MMTKELLIEKMCKVNLNYTKSFLNDVITDIEIKEEYGGIYTKVNFISDGNADNVYVISGRNNGYTYYDFSVNGEQYIEEDGGYYGEFLKQLQYIFDRHMINCIDIMKCLHGYEIVKNDFEGSSNDALKIKEITSNFVYNILKPESKKDNENDGDRAKRNFQKYAMQKAINITYCRFASEIEYKFKNNSDFIEIKNKLDERLEELKKIGESFDVPSLV